jgi:hypothetical protein
VNLEPVEVAGWRHLNVFVTSDGGNSVKIFGRYGVGDLFEEPGSSLLSSFPSGRREAFDLGPVRSPRFRVRLRKGSDIAPTTVELWLYLTN